MNCQTVQRENVIERYLSGTLEAGPKEQWEEHYFSCDHCAKLLETWIAIEKPLRRMDATIRAEIGPQKTASPARFRNARSANAWLWSGTALAAALLIGIGLRLIPATGGSISRSPAAAFATPPAPAQLAQLAQLDPPALNFPVTRGMATKAEAQFRRAMRSYPNHDYPAAIAGLRTTLSTDPDAPAPRFFLGACYLLSGNLDEGIRELDRVASGGSAFVEESRFYLAQGYLLQGRRQEALDQLHRVAAMQGEFGARARRLIERVAATQ